MNSYISVSDAKTTYYMILCDDKSDSVCACGSARDDGHIFHLDCCEAYIVLGAGLNCCTHSKQKFRFTTREGLARYIKYYMDSYGNDNMSEKYLATVIVPENAYMLELSCHNLELVFEAACVYVLSIEPIRYNPIWLDRTIMQELMKIAPNECFEAVQSYIPREAITHEMCIEAIARGCCYMSHLPREFITRELCMKVIESRDYFDIDVFPEELVDIEMYLMIFNKTGKYYSAGHIKQDRLKHICATFNTPELRLKLVSACGILLSVFPEDLIDRDMCIAALEKDARSFQYIPARHMDKKICQIAVAGCGAFIKQVPVEFMTAEICLAAVKKDSNLLKYVPVEFMTTEICSAAVTQNPQVLTDIPCLLINYEMFLAAVKKDGHLLKQVPAAIINNELCMTAVTQTGSAIQYVPVDLRTREIFDCAYQNWDVKSKVRLFSYLPKIYDHETGILRVITKDPESLALIKDQTKITSEIYMAALKTNPRVIEHIPVGRLTPEMCMEVVKQGFSVEYIPKELRTKEIFLEAIKHDIGTIEEIPEHLMDQQMLMTAVEQDGHALWFIPDKFITLELCKAAVEQNKNVLRYVPLTFLKDFITANASA